ncbi:epimerase [Brachybacterium sp. AOP25-B2-12]|uniref:epimerase n=1 Tax=Brachybacterium sp. AOP25-B2-12 TaxID=3457710 RepID=UPI004034AAF7
MTAEDAMNATDAMTAEDSRNGRVVIGGAGGFMGRHLQERYRAQGREVRTIGRGAADLSWDDPEGIARAVDGADLVIGLAGKSVDCRYTPTNRAEIVRSRVGTTAALARAIQRTEHPPALWVNSSTATIYRHAMDRPQTESTGELGTGFSVDVARAWETELTRVPLPATRRVALRSAIVLGDGGVLAVLRTLARRGLGGANWGGTWPVTPARVEAGTAHVPGSRRGAQRFSWVHLDDVARILDHLEGAEDLSGPVNAAAPGPRTNAELMRLVRRVTGARIGPPMPRWVSELGAMMLRTETELILKSRWVLPEKLTASGFVFEHPELEGALRASLPR